ncbi:hypothetical protein EV383_4437 [Pseudonocardia sediminis]|uniref:Uncharacterized protein n=1 Tax=Pseudonocardia sediminis TaxID=1397368 RepID=A0A4Q7UZE6_PSEST|nr:hypothetical protein [Pseudonocardia sediminis]RZT87512.1 hypothetical protein EV383_4437 [Pseudonocardia sediminis]
MNQHQQPRLITLAVDDDDVADLILRWLHDDPRIELPNGSVYRPRLADDGDVYLAAMHGLDLRDVTKVECSRQEELVADEK